MSDSDHDDGKLRDLYREAAAGDEPPAALDRRILEAAAQAAGRRQRARWWRPAGSLGGPLAGLASAAVLVLAVAVLLRQPEGSGPMVPAAGDAPATADRPQTASPTSPPAAAAAAAAERTQEVEPGRKALRRERMADVARQTVSEMHDAGTMAEAEPAIGPLGAHGNAAGPAGSAAAAFAAADCPEPFPLPAGATVRTRDQGLQVTVAGDEFVVRCVDGAWVRDPVPADPPGDGAQSNSQSNR